MARAHDNARAAAELTRLFVDMDSGDEARALRAMSEAAALLRQHGLSFRQMVQQIDERGLLLPPKVGAAIQLMDSATLAEAEGAFAGARRLMKGCGLTFQHIITALEHEPTEVGEIEQMRRAHQAAVEKAERLEAALRVIRSGAPMSMFRLTGIPIKGFVLAAALLFCLWLAVSIALTKLGMFRSASAEAPPPAAAKVLERDPVVPSPAPPAPPVARQDTPARASVADREPRPRARDRGRMRAALDYWDYHGRRFYDPPLYDPPRRQQFECWRDRSIRGPCFY